MAKVRESNRLRHGHARKGAHSPTYNTWASMIERCSSPRYHYYHRYGGRGIRVCERWMQFDAFLEDMGIRPKGKSLDRINNDGNYEPGNCRWRTAAEQRRNSCDTHLIRYNGALLCVTDWARLVGMNRQLLSDRLHAGWSIAKALNTPRRPMKNNRPEESKREVCCADCGLVLRTWHAQAFHTCPQQARANRRAQARQREQAAVPVLQVKCRCGAVATECNEQGVLLCTQCLADEDQAQHEAERDARELAQELNKGPWPR